MVYRGRGWFNIGSIVEIEGCYKFIIFIMYVLKYDIYLLFCDFGFVVIIVVLRYFLKLWFY